MDAVAIAAVAVGGIAAITSPLSAWLISRQRSGFEREEGQIARSYEQRASLYGEASELVWDFLHDIEKTMPAFQVGPDPSEATQEKRELRLERWRRMAARLEVFGSSEAAARFRGWSNASSAFYWSASIGKSAIDQNRPDLSDAWKAIDEARRLVWLRYDELLEAMRDDLASPGG